MYAPLMVDARLNMGTEEWIENLQTVNGVLERPTHVRMMCAIAEQSWVRKLGDNSSC